MELLYQNKYGAVYTITNSPNPLCEMQLIVDAVGLFLSRADLAHLMGILQNWQDPCMCDECGGNQCNKLWCTNPLIDICLKLEGSSLNMLEDLLKGSMFMLDMKATLEKHQLKPGKD